MAPKLIIPGDRLRKLRLQAVLSREELASAAGVSEGTIRAIETGVSDGVRPQTVRKLASVLGCSPSDISEIQEAAS